MTPVPADLERFVAFVLVGAAFSIGYPKRRVLILLLVLAGVGLLEIAQHFVPGRHGHFHDAVVKASGVVLGALTAMLVA